MAEKLEKQTKLFFLIRLMGLMWSVCGTADAKIK